MNELFEKYSKVQERRIHHQLMCQPRMSELYVESNGLHGGEMYEVSDEKCFDMDWSPFSKFFQGPLIICYNLGCVYLFLRLLLAGLFRYRGCNNVVVSSLKTLSSCSIVEKVLF